MNLFSQSVISRSKPRHYVLTLRVIAYPVGFVSSSCKKGLLSIKGDGELGLSRSIEKSAFSRSLLREWPRALLAHERSEEGGKRKLDEQTKNLKGISRILQRGWLYLDYPMIFSRECRLVPTFSKNPLDYRRRPRLVSDFFDDEGYHLVWHLRMWEKQNTLQGKKIRRAWSKDKIKIPGEYVSSLVDCWSAIPPEQEPKRRRILGDPVIETSSSEVTPPFCSLLIWIEKIVEKEIEYCYLDCRWK